MFRAQSMAASRIVQAGQTRQPANAWVVYGVPMVTDHDAVVVGAGVAGLAAASALRQAGRSCLVLEAADHPGGRARTVEEPALGGAPLDHGASWLHDADDNPLTPIAHAAGYALLDSAEHRQRRTVVGSRLATPAELDAYTATDERLGTALGARAAAEPDISFAAAIDEVATPADAAWRDTVECWEAPIIAAAEATALSLRDWWRNQLAGRNLMIRGGIGSFVRDTLGPPAGAIRTATPVTQIDWSGHGVVLETPAGTVRAQACIVTVSTGVLAGGAIRFIPPLPPALAQAIADLPMGLLSKVALRATGADRLDLAPFTGLDRQLSRRGSATMTFQAWPFGHDHIVGFVGGDAAWDLARAGDTAAEAFARENLHQLFGSRAKAAFAGGGCAPTRWGTDPLTGGAYCYARPGSADARMILGGLLTGPHLLFAGEATHTTHGGTVGGAYASGVRAAQSVVQMLTASGNAKG